ncbi:MAG TPA: hypothetical protein VFQ53_23770 [Kofleriaceae bacterium]|nr:hypothetical protein [Kofleriaceae bacterium]
MVAWVGVARAQPKPAPSQGTDFAVQARTLYRVAACAGDEPIPQRLSVKIVERHCKGMRDLYATHHARWADKAQKFISELRPKDAPKVVVYPFGGGDLSTALVAFPDATEITTISLEAAGDVRAIDTVKPGTLAVDLGVVTEDIRRLYFAAYSATKSLQAASRSPTFPGTLMFAFAGLALHDMEPVSLRYFDIEKDGSLRYLGAEELDQRAAELAKKGPAKPKTVKHYWYEHDSAFGNVEIQFRPRGDAKAPLRTYRHIVQNLDDTHLKADDRLLVHLRAKGTISAMTKAASFLLWYDDFTQIRDYLVGNIAWMISDSTGIPPAYADKAGLEQITYGDFAGPLFQIDPKNVRAQFVKLWKSQPRRPLGFRFGYRDLEKHPHLMITRRKP